MATSSSSALRMSGINSGFDTESIVSALTAATKSKINTNDRKVLKLQAQQTAYRSVISSMTAFKSKYFDVLNRETYLKSSSAFNSYTNKLTNSSGTTATGVTCVCGKYATTGTYNITVNNAATQATYTSSGSSGGALDFSDCTDSGKTYSTLVTYNGTTKNITFSGGDETAVRSNINSALTAFGTNNDGSGIVSVNSENKLVSSDLQTVSSNGTALYSSSQTLQLSSLQTGTNTLSVTVGTTTKTVSFNTAGADYFDNVFDTEGNLLTVTEGMSDEQKALINSYNSAVDSFYDAEMSNSFEAWSASASETDKDTLYGQYYAQFAAETHDDYFAQAKQSAYDAAVTAGTISSTEGDPNYQSLADFAFTETDFEASDKYQSYTDTVLTEETYRATYDADSQMQLDAYKAFVNTTTRNEFAAGITQADTTEYLNENYIKNSLGSLSFTEGSFSVAFNGDGTATVSAKTSGGSALAFSATEAAANASDLGFETTSSSASSHNQISTTSKLSNLGLTADSSGKYNFKINGVSFSFAGTVTVREMMRSVTNSTAAGVSMSYSTLSDAFSITAKEYGNKATIAFEDGSEGLLNALGFNSSSTFKKGENLNLTINDTTVETASNSYTVDESTYTFTSLSEGQTYTNQITRDYSKTIDTIKSFVADYNALIKTVYGYTDEEPDDDYYFLTDADKEELALSDTQEEKWETMAKKGILYQDSALTSVMSKLRSSLYSSVETADNKKIGLYSIGITTSSNWNDHGTLTIDEKALTAALETYGDDISTLFSDATNGIMTKFSDALDTAVKSTGARKDKGSLVQLAGIESTSSSTDNAIYDKIKDLQTLISSLNDRYDNEQDRYWAKFSNMESMLQNLNSQSSYISQLANMSS